MPRSCPLRAPLRIATIVAIPLLLAGGLPASLAAQLPGGADQVASTPPAFSSELAVQTFDSVWSRIANSHYDPDMGGVDWDAVRAELVPLARASSSNAELRSVLREMLGRLGLSHFGIFAPEAAATLDGDLDPESSGASGQASPGIDLRVVEGALAVVRVRDRSPAESAGVRAGWTLLSVGGRDVTTLPDGLALPGMEGDSAAGGPDADARSRALYLPSVALALLQGESGSEVEAVFVDSEGAERAVRLERAPPPGEIVRFGFLPPFPVEIEDREIPHPDGGTVGWIRFSGWFPAVYAGLAEAVDRHRDTCGIVLDLRGNPGGVGAMAMGVGGHFIDEAAELGVMRTRDTTLRFVVNPQRVSPAGVRVTPFGGPVALLVDPLTASTSEIFAAGLQSLDRARVFGETTAGQALPAVVISLPNGDRLMHVIADYTAPGDVRLEGRGVVPDESAPPTLEALRQGRDPALDRALDWMSESCRTDLVPVPATTP
jgi:carboxyl-terminal processing protease